MPGGEEMPVLRKITPEEVEELTFEPVDPKAREQALAIITDVKDNGEEALLKCAWKFGEIPQNSRKIIIARDELKTAFESLPVDQQGVLERTAARIRAFAEAQRSSIKEVEVPIDGGHAGQVVVPVDRAGCYAPGGRYPLPSSVLMTACTARVAGVPNVVVASPRPSDVTRAAAYVAGADCLLAIGGAHAIAAMAHGIGVPPCDIIVGPGNKWVTAAKSIVSGICGIDMLAGPSEVLVIADGTADPEVIASDLLAQAEHDVEARPILVTPEASVVGTVNAALSRQLATLPTRDVAIPAVRQGFAVLTPSMEAAIAVTNKIGPEHLEVQTKNFQEVSDALKSFGGLFIGGMAAEVLGDYGAGPNHVLPTSCTAKYTGGLSVHTFLRIRTWMRIDDQEAAQQLVKDATALARLEGLEGHARAAEQRLCSAKRQKVSEKQA
jgi:phosphoribosyl-ATP pyrophosphohydrolase/phosphoribosyl-AMP cyclohydrolase/histidinol dehydrogenase